MSRNYGVLVVEGVTDQAVVARALRLLGLKRFSGRIEELETFWRKEAMVVPHFPPKSGSLYDRLPMPSILLNDAASVAVYAGGGSNLIVKVRELLANHDLNEKLSMFGVIADSDDNQAADVARKYQREFQAMFPAFPDKPGHVVVGPPSLGMFVLPDNSRQGVVEHLVIECGESVYPTYLDRARKYVSEFTQEDRTKKGWAPFDEEKALIASVASLLKPGKTNIASIADNLWVSAHTSASPMLATLLAFLGRLIGIHPSGGDLPPPPSLETAPPAAG